MKISTDCNGKIQDKSKPEDFYGLIAKSPAVPDPVDEINKDQLIKGYANFITEEQIECLNAAYADLMAVKKSRAKEYQQCLENCRRNLREERRRFCEDCDFRAESIGKVENILYTKADFIEEKRERILNSPESKRKEILDRLLADVNSIFTENDTHFKHYKRNKNVIKSDNRYRISRADKLNNIIEKLRVEPFWKSLSIAESDKDLYLEAFKKIWKERGKKRLYEYIVEHYLGPEYSCEKFRDLFPNDDNLKIHCDVFYRDVLRRLAEACKMPGYPRIVKLDIDVDRGSAIMFVYYQLRLSRLRALFEKFAPVLSPLMEVKISFGCITLDEYDQLQQTPYGEPMIQTNTIKQEIYAYFKSLGEPLPCRSANHNLECRILWILKNYSGYNKWVPFIITFMLIAYDRKLTQWGSIDLSKIKRPTYNERIKKAKQRFLQICFLNTLCQKFALNRKDVKYNFQQYLFWQGTNILSKDEAKEWEKIFEKNSMTYEDFPVIGFQLCCLKYAESCMPLNLKRLSFNWTSKFSQKNFGAFWKQNQELLENQAAEFQKLYSDEVEKYLMLHNDYRNFAIHHIDYLDCSVCSIVTKSLSTSPPVLDLDRYTGVQKDKLTPKEKMEIKRIIVEIEILMCIRNTAMRSLSILCEKIYGLSRGLFYPLE